MYYCNYKNPPTPDLDQNDGTDIVDITGYIPPEQRIRSLIIAGQNLISYRKEQYDLQVGDDGDIDDESIDPQPYFSTEMDAYDAYDQLKLKYRYGKNTTSQEKDLSVPSGGLESGDSKSDVSETTNPTIA